MNLNSDNQGISQELKDFATRINDGDFSCVSEMNESEFSAMLSRFVFKKESDIYILDAFFSKTSSADVKIYTAIAMVYYSRSNISLFEFYRKSIKFLQIQTDFDMSDMMKSHPIREIQQKNMVFQELNPIGYVLNSTRDHILLGSFAGIPSANSDTF